MILEPGDLIINNVLGKHISIVLTYPKQRCLFVDGDLLEESYVKAYSHGCAYIRTYSFYYDNENKLVLQHLTTIQKVKK